MNKRLIAVAFACAVSALVPRAASAQTFLTAAGGITTGGDAPAQKFTGAFDLTIMGKVLGVEADIGYTPDFFNEQTGVALVADSNVTTLMANLLVGVGGGPVRPYFTIGTGLLRSRVTGDLLNDVHTNDWGLNAGVGVMGLLGDHWGLRADGRYFRALQDNQNAVSIGSFDFWRVTGGIVFKF
ncbi:MAG: outer membrane beta-barrel protein [Acidobacteriota bacterium]